MENPKINTKVVHSKTKAAWNIIGIKLGGKYKIARFPYLLTECEKLNDINKREAFNHAEFTSFCFNNSEQFFT